MFVLDSRAWLVRQEVGNVLLGEGGTFALVALAVGAIVERLHPALRPVKLRGRETELLNAASLQLERRQTGGNPAILDTRAEGEHLDARAERAVARPGPEKSGVCLACELPKALVDHLLEKVLDQASSVVRDEPVPILPALLADLYARLRGLGIGRDVDERLLVQRHGGVGRPCRSRPGFQGTEGRADLGFDLDRVDVADNDDRHP